MIRSVKERTRGTGRRDRRIREVRARLGRPLRRRLPRPGSPYNDGVAGSVVVLLAAAALTLVVLAPVLAAPVSGVVYAVASLVCHQLPERSFHLGAFQLPVCARCAGIYTGAVWGAAAAVLAPSGSTARLTTARRLAVMAATPTLATVVLETAGFWAPSNATRAAAGLPLGLVVAFTAVRALGGRPGDDHHAGGKSRAGVIH